MTTLEEVSRKLSASSRRHFVNPDEVIVWPEIVDETSWCMSPELVSLYGTPTWEALDDNERKTLCFWEAINFFSLNLHGESALLEGVAQRVNRDEFSDISEYLRHFIDEENKHSMWFAKFCRRYGNKIYPERKVGFPTERVNDDEDILFFAQISLFEELVDRFNILTAADDRVHPLVREINRLHHADESRHLQFGRKMVFDMWAKWSPSKTQSEKDQLILRLEQYVETTWRQFYNPAVYADAGIAEPAKVARDAWNDRSEMRSNMSKSCRRLISDLAEASRSSD